MSIYGNVCAPQWELQKTKPVYDAYRKARNREKYRAGQEQAISLHEAAARTLKAAGIARLPNLAALQSEYEALQAQKEALYADYGKLKKKVRELSLIHIYKNIRSKHRKRVPTSVFSPPALRRVG